MVLVMMFGYCFLVLKKLAKSQFKSD